MTLVRSLLLVLIAAGMLAVPSALRAQGRNEPLLAERYYQTRQYDKAQLLYERLAREEPEHPAYPLRWVECLQRLGRREDALDACVRSLRRTPERLDLRVARAELLEALSRPDDAKTERQAVVASLTSFEEVQQAASLFTSRQRFEWAEQAYRRGRTLPGLEGAFAGELATVLAAAGKPEEAAREWIDLYRRSPNFYPAVRQQLLRLSNPRSAPGLERVLLQALAANAQDGGLRELLLDLYLQTENYASAIAQARVLDRQRREGGARLYQLAQALQQNGKYELSTQALDYALPLAKGTSLAMQAYALRARNIEMAARSRRPVDTLGLRRAVAAYDSLVRQNGLLPEFASLLLSKARICALYLHDLPAAAATIKQLMTLPLDAADRAQAQLLSGDVLVMQANYAQARLAYEEVIASQHEGPLGAQAKLNDARLAYYKGDFLYAKARLLALKQNHSDEIANDAIRLFLLIQDNLGTDSSVSALLPFARAQLLVLQYDYTAAFALLDSVQSAFPGHPITDDILWEKGQAYIQLADPELALVLFKQLVERYDQSVLADDALMAIAELYHYSLKNPEQAQATYLELLSKYPASLYGVEARKRLRELRGEGPT